MSKAAIVFSLLIYSTQSFTQSSNELLAFKRNAINAFRSNAKFFSDAPIKTGKKIDYLAPLADLYANKKDPSNNDILTGYFDHLGQTISFLGDYKSVLEYLRLQNNSPDENTAAGLQQQIDGYNGAYLVDAKKTILEMSRSRSVVMINEAHCKPLHRAFMYSLLDEFYSLGFRYLAMETLNNSQGSELQKLTVNTGYYTCEPLAGELVRKALNLGFKLIPYEDTSRNSNLRQRDSAQAMHLYEIIKSDPSARMLVFAGYAHIQKSKDNGEFVSMGYQFKQLANVDPLSIDQTFMSEVGHDGFSTLYYQLLQKKFPATIPSVLVKSNKPVMLLPDKGNYDLRIIHPPVTYYRGRATWYDLDKERKPRNINVPDKNVFLIQAYYIDEWKKNMEDSIIPADQTYIKYKSKSPVLFLREGKYKIVFRDMEYKVLSTKTISLK